MAVRRAILVVEYEELDNGYDTAGEIALMAAGCIADMESSSFPELRVAGYGSVSELQSDFENKIGIFAEEGDFLPASLNPRPNRSA